MTAYSTTAPYRPPTPPSPTPPVKTPSHQSSPEGADDLIVAVLPLEVWAEIKAFVSGSRSGQLTLDFKTGMVQSYKVYKVIVPSRTGMGQRGATG